MITTITPRKALFQTTLGLVCPPGVAKLASVSWNIFRWSYHATRLVHLHKGEKSLQNSITAATITGVSESIPPVKVILQIALTAKGIKDIYDAHMQLTEEFKNLTSLFTSAYPPGYPHDQERILSKKMFPLISYGTEKKLRQVFLRTKMTFYALLETIAKISKIVFYLINKYEDVLEIIQGKTLPMYEHTVELVKLKNEYIDSLQVQGSELGELIQELHEYIVPYFVNLKLDKEYVEQQTTDMQKQITKVLKAEKTLKNQTKYATDSWKKAGKTIKTTVSNLKKSGSFVSPYPKTWLQETQTHPSYLGQVY